MKSGGIESIARAIARDVDPQTTETIQRAPQGLATEPWSQARVDQRQSSGRSFRSAALIAGRGCSGARPGLERRAVVFHAEADGADAGHHRLLRALVQPLASAAHRSQELVEVRLERGEDPVGPILHLEPRLARLAPRLVDDLLRLPLRQLDDLRLRGLTDGLLARLLEQPVLLALRLGEHLLALLDDPARLLDLLGDRRAHLVEDVVDLLAVDPHLVGEGDGLRVVHEVVELVDENEYVHECAILLLLAEWCPATPVGEHLLQAPRDRMWDKFLDVSTERRDLLHAARGHEADLRAGHHVDRLDLRREVAVELVHLELPLEIGYDAQALHDHLRVPAAREVDDELLEDVDLDVADRRQLVAQELDALLDREHRLLVVGIADDADDDPVEDPRGALDHVDVPVRDGVVRAGVDGGDQCAKRVMRAAPYLREVRTSSPSISGCVRAPVS